MKKKLIIIVILLLTIIGALFFGADIILDSMLNKIEIENTPIEIEEIENTVVEDDTPKAHEVVNFMLVGADNLDRVDREASWVEQRSDVLKLVSLDYSDKVIKLTSLDRDVVVWIPDKGENGQFGHFNWAYSFGGAKYAINAINYNLDLDVSKYVSFSFAGFIEVIDVLGGINVELTQIEANTLNNNSRKTMTVYEGPNYLDGHTALNYARIRKIDSDFERMNRQNIVIKAVINELKDCSFTEIMDVINKCLPYINTNITAEEIKEYLFDVLSFDLNNIYTQTYPKDETKDVMWNHNDIGGYIIRSYSNQVIELHKYIYGTDTYKPTQKVYDTEKQIYELCGEFKETGVLLP